MIGIRSAVSLGGVRGTSSSARIHKCPSVTIIIICYEYGIVVRKKEKSVLFYNVK